MTKIWREGWRGRIVLAVFAVAAVLVPILIWAAIEKERRCAAVGGKTFSSGICVRPDGRVLF